MKLLMAIGRARDYGGNNMKEGKDGKEEKGGERKLGKRRERKGKKKKDKGKKGGGLEER